ncbi:hypothetical protein METSCH_D08510 [Metschnikowia aff. pulcherrima]|uniref:Uncharacterized protein n=1 Tax=Metschnikowia aff. pulcherrima TaxID=2163413 RepID=A0A4P6XUA3_9ASCO|nr:hypothetical protein METSCH_D08510 [Metschnikowia aff. pulcherrima]
MRNTKCTSHKGLGGLGTKNVSAGEGSNINTAVIVEYEPKKRQREGCRERKRRNREKGELKVR